MNFLRTLSHRALLIALASALAACATTPAQVATPAARAAAAPAAQTTPVAVKASVSASGELTLARTALSLSFDTTSRITAVNVRVGQSVKKGDVLATVDESSLRDAVADAQLSLDLTKANIAASNVPATKEAIAAAEAALNSAYASYATTKAGKTQTEIDNARISAESAWLGYLSSQASRDKACGTKDGLEAQGCKSAEASYGNAYESMLTARQNYETVLEPVAQSSLTQASASITSAKARLEALKAGPTEAQTKANEVQISQAQSALDRAKTNLAKAILVSPCDCVVQDVTAVAGALPSGVAFTLVDLSVLQFKTSNLVERDVAAMKVGAPVSIRLKAYTDDFTGKVSAVLSQSSGTQSGTAVYTVLISLDPTTRKLLPGMTGQADIVKL
jgi:HlyD family secretion protein